MVPTSLRGWLPEPGSGLVPKALVRLVEALLALLIGLLLLHTPELLVVRTHMLTLIEQRNQ